nr:hypothetical protein [Tanacetum cinerariifolium]
MLDMQVTLHDKRIVMQVTLNYEAIVMKVTLHDKRIVMQVTLHYEAIVMQVMLHDKRIVMQVTLHYEAIVMQVTLHDRRIVIGNAISNQSLDGSQIMAGVSDVDKTFDDELGYLLWLFPEMIILTIDLIGDEDPTNKDGDTEVLVSLGEISSEGKKSWESDIGDCNNTGDGGSYEDYKRVGAEVEPLEPGFEFDDQEWVEIETFSFDLLGSSLSKLLLVLRVIEEEVGDELETNMEDVEGCLWCRDFHGAKGRDVAIFRTKKWIVVLVRWVRVLDMQVTLHDKRIVMQVTLHYEAIVMQVTLHDKRIVMQVTLNYEALVTQVTLHDKRIVMQVTLHYEAIVMQVTLHDKRIVMQVTLHYEAIVMQVTLHDKRIVMQVMLH